MNNQTKKVIVALCFTFILTGLIVLILPELTMATSSNAKIESEIDELIGSQNSKAIDKLQEQITEIEQNGVEADTSSKAEPLPIISFFDDIMGFSGYCEDILDFELYVRTYYAGLPTDSNRVKLAECWNWQIDNYSIDIDHDGVKELICNCMSGGDSHREVYVYRWNGKQVEIGYVDWLKYGIDNLFYWGCNAVQTEYDSKTGKIVIDYCPREGNQEHFYNLEVGFDWISFSTWDGENFPGIDIDLAYEIYGET